MSSRFLVYRKGDQMNKVIMTGNLVRDTEPNNKDNLFVAKNAIAVKRPRSKNDETDFFNIVAFGKTGEFLNQWFHKGSRAIIEGRIQNNNYTDKDGVKHYSTEIVVDNIEFADSKKKDSDTGISEPPETDTYAAQDDVDVPF